MIPDIRTIIDLIKQYEVSILQIVVYAFTFISRFAGFGIHAQLFHHQIDGSNNEVLRFGSDLALMALGVFIGACRSDTSLFSRTIVASNSSPPLWFIIGAAVFLIIYFIAYCLYLCLIGEPLYSIFSIRVSLAWLKLITAYALSLLIGVVALGFAGTLATTSAK